MPNVGTVFDDGMIFQEYQKGDERCMLVTSKDK